MDTINKWTDIISHSLLSLGEHLSFSIGNLIGAILVLIIGWILVKIILYILARILKTIKIDSLKSKLFESNVFKGVNLNFTISKVILSFAKWILYLAIFVVATDIMNWQVVSNEIGKVFNYLPKLFSAIALFFIGLYVANFIKKLIYNALNAMHLNGSKAISQLAFVVIMIIISITALNQAAIDTSIIANNLNIILAGMVLLLVIAIGLGSKDIVEKLLLSFYTKKEYQIGSHIKTDQFEGTIVSINNLFVKIKNENKIISIPIKDFEKQIITIINN